METNRSYRDAGVNLDAGYEAVDRIKQQVERTRTKGVLSSVGAFSGLFQPDLTGIDEPVFVSGTDGVGTKLKLAFLLDRHDTIGIDAVAMCVNDIICCGARPLFFLDYIATGKLDPLVVEQIVKGIADGCVDAGCALIGGETAEMPGFYAAGEYDLAGFAVGMVDKHKILDRTAAKEGDLLIGLSSSGVHSNGFSLIRKVFGIGGSDTPKAPRAVLETLLTPTRIYVRPILSLLESRARIHGISNITGGGFFENIPRALPDGLGARIDRQSLAVPEIFDIIQKTGNIPDHDMFATFNMGIGMVLVAAKEDGDLALAALTEAGEQPTLIGEVIRSEQGVIL